MIGSNTSPAHVAVYVKWLIPPPAVDHRYPAPGWMVGEQFVPLSESFMDNTDPNAELMSPQGLKKNFSFTVKPGRNTFDIEIAGD